MLLKIRWLLSDLLFEYEQTYGLYHDKTKAVRELYLDVCREMELNNIPLTI